jgi:RNA-dependent RNA polymerase
LLEKIPFQLLEYYRPSAAWVQRNPPKKTEQKKPQDFNGPELENQLFLEFLQTRFTPRYFYLTAVLLSHKACKKAG